MTAPREYLRMGRGLDKKLYIWKYLGGSQTGLPINPKFVERKEIPENGIECADFTIPRDKRRS
ncbi:MAG: hypothetical protein RBT65_19560 [Methanolobus sp.]|nr:hypothetical protein [Methanolobus sp.]